MSPHINVWNLFKYHFQALTDSGGYDVTAVKETIKKSFLKMDEFLRERLKERNDRSGTTCTALLVAPNHYFFINCGDSRGMLTKLWIEKNYQNETLLDQLNQS